jgi:hypothetical protein
MQVPTVRSATHRLGVAKLVDVDLDFGLLAVAVPPVVGGVVGQRGAASGWSRPSRSVTGKRAADAGPLPPESRLALRPGLAG